MLVTHEKGIRMAVFGSMYSTRLSTGLAPRETFLLLLLFGFALDRGFGCALTIVVEDVSCSPSTAVLFLFFGIDGSSSTPPGKKTGHFKALRLSFGRKCSGTRTGSLTASAQRSSIGISEFPTGPLTKRSLSPVRAPEIEVLHDPPLDFNHRVSQAISMPLEMSVRG